MLAVLPVFAQPPGTGEPAEREADRAAAPAALFAQGNDHYNADRYGEAEAAFLEAWKLRRTYDIAVNLGHAEFQLKKEPEAAGYLAFALRNWPAVRKGTERALAASRLEGLRKKLGLLKIQANVADAEISVDGTSLRDSPVAPEVYVRPGKHAIRASRAGFIPVETVISIGEGELRSVPLSLLPVERRSAPSVAANRGGMPLLPLVLGGAGIVVAGAGAGFVIASQVKYEEVRNTSAPLPALYCRPPATGQRLSVCEELESDARMGDAFEAIGISALGAGGAAIAGAVLYYVISPSKEESRTGYRLQPVIAGSQGGLQVSGSF